MLTAISTGRYNGFRVSIPVGISPVYQEVAGAGTILPASRASAYLKTKVLRPTERSYGLSADSMIMQDDKQDQLAGLTSPKKSGLLGNEFNQAQAAELLSKAPTVTNVFSRMESCSTEDLSPSSLYPMLRRISMIFRYARPFRAVLPAIRPWRGIRITEEMILPLRSWEDGHLACMMLEPSRAPAPDNDPTSYINDGFDELQVYWAVTQLFDSLPIDGFTASGAIHSSLHAFSLS